MDDGGFPDCCGSICDFYFLNYKNVGESWWQENRMFHIRELSRLCAGISRYDSDNHWIDGGICIH